MDNAQSTEANATSRVADAPFNDPSGDIILRSSDADMVDFRTHKVFLIHASPFFETMLSLPQSQGAPTQESTIPIVEMHENPEDLRSVLLFCQPGTVHEPPTSLIRLNQLYRITDKYEIEGIKGWLRTCLGSFTEKAPVGVYCLARHFEWKEEAQLAAKKCLSYPLFELKAWSDPILQEISPEFLQTLYSYHQQCSKFFRDAMSPGSWLWQWYWSPFLPRFELSTEACCGFGEPRNSNQWVYLRFWWDHFMSEYGEALSKIPCLNKVPLAEIFCKVSKETGKCTNCGPVALEQLFEFEGIIKAELSSKMEDMVRHSDSLESLTYFILHQLECHRLAFPRINTEYQRDIDPYPCIYKQNESLKHSHKLQINLLT